MKQIETFCEALKAAGYSKVEIQKERIISLVPGKDRERIKPAPGARMNILAVPSSLLDGEKQFAGVPVLQKSGLIASNIHIFNGALVFIGVKPTEKKES